MVPGLMQEASAVVVRGRALECVTHLISTRAVTIVTLWSHRSVGEFQIHIRIHNIWVLDSQKAHNSRYTPSQLNTTVCSLHITQGSSFATKYGVYSSTRSSRQCTLNVMNSVQTMAFRPCYSGCTCIRQTCRHSLKYLSASMKGTAGAELTQWRRRNC